MRRCDLNLGNAQGGDLERIEANIANLQNRRRELERRIARYDEGIEAARRLLREEWRRRHAQYVPGDTPLRPGHCAGLARPHF